MVEDVPRRVVERRRAPRVSVTRRNSPGLTRPIAVNGFWTTWSSSAGELLDELVGAASRAAPIALLVHAQQDREERRRRAASSGTSGSDQERGRRSRCDLVLRSRAAEAAAARQARAPSASARIGCRRASRSARRTSAGEPRQSGRRRRRGSPRSRRAARPPADLARGAARPCSRSGAAPRPVSSQVVEPLGALGSPSGIALAVREERSSPAPAACDELARGDASTGAVDVAHAGSGSRAAARHRRPMSAASIDQAREVHVVERAEVEHGAVRDAVAHRGEQRLDVALARPREPARRPSGNAGTASTTLRRVYKSNRSEKCRILLAPRTRARGRGRERPRGSRRGSRCASSDVFE